MYCKTLTNRGASRKGAIDDKAIWLVFRVDNVASVFSLHGSLTGTVLVDGVGIAVIWTRDKAASGSVSGIPVDSAQ